MNNNKFEEMSNLALSSIDDDLQESRDNEFNHSIYKVSQELQNKNYKYDNDSLYCHLNDSYYLKVSREKSKFSFTIGTYIDCTFKACSLEYTSNKSICEFNKDRNKQLNEFALKINNSFEDDEDKPFKEINIQDKLDEFAIDLLNEDDYAQINKDFKVYQELCELDEDDESHDQTFDDYDDIVKSQALKLIHDDSLFEKLQESISLTHEGNEQLKIKLPLILASLFVDAPIQSELDADSGKGKTDVIVETIKNFPQRYVHILRTISPKNIYYDKDSYNDDFNIVVFDDVILKSDMIEVIKEIADNKKPIKELRTVIDGKSKKFTLKGKFLVILTYAKSNPDEELLNRLYKLDIIIDKQDEKTKIKEKIKDNAIINSENNEIIARNRMFIQCAIQYLIEKQITIFNPFITMFNPNDFNNRDIKSFVSMVKSKTFYHAYHRKRISINDNDVTIGSYEDFNQVNELWIEDHDVQKYKLNARQKQILELLPCMTKEDAYERNELILEDWNDSQSRRYKDSIIEKEFTLKKLAKELSCNIETLRNDIDRKSEGTSKTLLDLGLIDKIKFDENNSRSPNIYFKVKHEDSNLEGDASISSKTYRYNRYIQFNDLINNYYYKLKIINDLLVSLNISLNKKGYIFLDTYCKNYDNDIDVCDYNSYFKFIEGFFDEFNEDKYMISLEDAKQEDIEYMNEFSQRIKKGIQEDHHENVHEIEEKNLSPSREIFNDSQEINDDAQNQKQEDIQIVNDEKTIETIDESSNKELLESLGIDYDLALEIGFILSENDFSIDEIRTILCQDLNPQDVDSHFIVVKIDKAIKKLKEHDFISESINSNLVRMHIEDKFMNIIDDDVDRR